MSPTSSNEINPWSESLLELLQSQHAIVDQLVEMADSQASLIAAGRTEQLLELLARRQATIDEFTASQTQLAELTQHLDERLQTASIAARDQIKLLINDIGDRLSKVMRRDEQDQASLRDNCNQIKQEMTSMGASRQARNAYFPNSNQITRFADRRG